MFPSLLEEGAAKTTRENPARQEGFSAPGALEEGGGQMGGIRQLVLVLEKIQMVSVASGSF